MSKATTTSVCFEAEAIRNAREYADDAARRVKEKDKQIEAQAAEITRLRALVAETETLAARRADFIETHVSLIRRQTEEIARLRAELATARRDGMEEAAQDLEGRAKMLRSYDPDSVGAHWALHYAAAIRAAAGDDRPSEEIIRADRDAWEVK